MKDKCPTRRRSGEACSPKTALRNDKKAQRSLKRADGRETRRAKRELERKGRPPLRKSMLSKSLRRRANEAKQAAKAKKT